MTRPIAGDVLLERTKDAILSEAMAVAEMREVLTALHASYAALRDLGAASSIPVPGYAEWLAAQPKQER